MTTINQNQSSGLRHNTGKLPFHLISWKAIEEIAKVLHFGATKYAPRNWEKGLSYSDTFASLQRHLSAWFNGEANDAETGLSHMAHVLCNAMFLMHFILTGTGTDDRPAIKQAAPAIKEPLPNDPNQARQIYPPSIPITSGRIVSQPNFPQPTNESFGSRVEQGYSGFLSEGSGNAMESGRVSNIQEDVFKTSVGGHPSYGGVVGYGNTYLDGY